MKTDYRSQTFYGGWGTVVTNHAFIYNEYGEVTENSPY